MKRVVLIGKFNEITREINESLSPFCQVQLCSDNVEVAKGMVRMVQPDMAIISLLGALSAQEEIFSFLIREYSNVPILAVGSQSVEDQLNESGFLAGGRVEFLRRPQKLEDIVNRARQILNMTGGKFKAGAEGKQTILVVDDSPAFQRAMYSMLTPAYRVVFATSGHQALAVVAKGKPDLILLDYEMPVCDGKMTLQMLRAEETTRDIPVVFLTGMANSDHVQELLALLPNDYLLKPPSKERLFSTIEKILGKPESGFVGRGGKR